MEYVAPNEPHDVRLRRLRMRSWRRGIKEMDLILGSYADKRLEGLSLDDLETYDLMLSENDQDLYAWVTGQGEPPAHLTRMIAMIAKHAEAL